MAGKDSTLIATVQKYKLPHEDRKAILARSDSAKLALKIEKKRMEFIALYGSEFGTELGQEISLKKSFITFAAKLF